MLKKISFLLFVLFCAGLPFWLISTTLAAPQLTTRYVATTGADSGNCSSPASPCATIQYAHNQATAGDTIQIAAGAYVGQAILNRSITLEGADAETTILDGNGGESAVQLFDAASSLTIRQLTIRNGGKYGISSGGATLIEEAIIRDNNPPPGNHGSGIRVWGPTTIRYTSIYSNSGLYGGGIDTSGPLTVTHSVIYGNAAGQSGGGIHLNGGAAVLIENSTISGNQSAVSGGGISIGASGATLDLRQVTITANQAGGSNTAGGINGYNNSTPITMSHTIIANNLGDHQCSQANGAWQSLGYNLSSDGTCHLTGTGDLPDSNPLFGPLADNGGDTLTHAIGPTSPALDAGDNATCAATDQRGRVRPYDGDDDGTATCDMGAYEYGSTDTPPPPQTTRYVATTGNDSGNNCLNQANPCATIQHAHDQAFGGETVQIAAGTYVENVTIAKNVILQGADPLTTFIDGSGGAARVIAMSYNPFYNVVIRNLSIHGGQGGIHASGGTLLVENCRIYDNDASNEFYDDGGGLYLWGPATIRNSSIYSNTGQYGGGINTTQPLTLTDSVLYANTATIDGGGLAVTINSGGSATVQNSTISGNQAANYGGGVYVGGAGTQLFLQHVTVVHNQISSTNSTAGVFASAASVTLRNSLIAHNTGTLQCNANTATFTSDGNNLASDDSCGLTQPGDLPNANPQLGPLQDNGGETLTHALLIGSPAVDAANGAHCLPADQRGMARPAGAACDIGAYEADGSEPPPGTQYRIYLPMITR